jgi:predicted flap endonuclease-1-like 5' DNA nuclease
MAHYKIEDIEGIGPVYSRRLRKAGIRSVASFLKRSCHRKGRRELAAATGLKEDLILKWANMADLYRIKGVGSEYAELLEKAGVDTVKELRRRNPESLNASMAKVNRRGRARVRRLPGLKRVRSWVNKAKKLKPLVRY